jgi:hypothetical protein
MAAGKVEPPARTFYRNRVGNFLNCAICAIVALVLLNQLATNIGEQNPSPIVVGNAIFLAAFVMSAARLSAIGVVVTSDGIKIRNVLRNHVVRWDEIKSFELDLNEPPPRCGKVVLDDGRQIRMTGVGYGRASHFAQNTVDALNRQLAGSKCSMQEDLAKPTAGLHRSGSGKLPPAPSAVDA